MADFTIPQLMKFTVLPYRLTARAWLDPQFSEALCSYPKAFLAEKSVLFPRSAQYIVVRDTPSLKHFILPYLGDVLRKLSPEQLEALIAKETGEDGGLEEFLPVPVIKKALTDPSYRASLIANPNRIVREVAGENKYNLSILENSESTFHLPLRLNPGLSDDFETIYRQLSHKGLYHSSSGCCASGTCNEEE